jgi:hypothetical protein
MRGVFIPAHHMKGLCTKTLHLGVEITESGEVGAKLLKCLGLGVLSAFRYFCT